MKAFFLGKKLEFGNEGVFQNSENLEFGKMSSFLKFWKYTFFGFWIFKDLEIHLTLKLWKYTFWGNNVLNFSKSNHSSVWTWNAFAVCNSPNLYVCWSFCSSCGPDLCFLEMFCYENMFLESVPGKCSSLPSAWKVGKEIECKDGTFFQGCRLRTPDCQGRDCRDCQGRASSAPHPIRFSSENFVKSNLFDQSKSYMSNNDMASTCGTKSYMYIAVLDMPPTPIV